MPEAHPTAARKDVAYEDISAAIEMVIQGLGIKKTSEGQAFEKKDGRGLVLTEPLGEPASRPSMPMFRNLLKVILKQ